MAKNKETIKKEINEFVAKHKGEYPDYYIGITKHIGQRLVETLNEHMDKGEYTKGTTVYTAECHNRDEAVEIEQFFQDEGDGMLQYNLRSHGDIESVFVYCYKVDEGNKKMILENINSTDGKYVMQYIKGVDDYKKDGK